MNFPGPEQDAHSLGKSLITTAAPSDHWRQTSPLTPLTPAERVYLHILFEPVICNHRTLGNTALHNNIFFSHGKTSAVED